VSAAAHPAPATASEQARDYIRPMMLPAEHAAMLDRIERCARYAWAAQVAEGRAVLDIGCGDGSGTAILSAAGASPLLGVDASAEAVQSARAEFGHLARFEVAEPMALPSSEGGFDLVTCFGVLEVAPEPEAVLAGIERVLKPEGLLLASLASGGDGAQQQAEWLRRRFRTVALHDQADYAGSAIGGPPTAPISARVTEPQAEGRRSVVAVAGNGTLPALQPQASFEEITGLQALAESVSRWEERARGAEAEVAAMRWELRIAGEKLTALVQRLLELENAPSRRLRRRLKGEPARYSADEAADPAGSARGPR
jgi:protein-L-isoaspartate O-methyltransferase